MFQVLELPDDFYPTDMHWIPRGGGGAPGNQHQPPDNQLMKTGRLLSGKKAGGGSDLFLLTSATGRLQLVTQCETRSLKLVLVPRPQKAKTSKIISIMTLLTFFLVPKNVFGPPPMSAANFNVKDWGEKGEYFTSSTP